MLKLDNIDLKILAALQQDGRITKLGLADRAGLSAAACWARMARLEKANIITGYSANIDVSRIRQFATVLVEITLKSHRQADFRRFEAAVVHEPLIIECDAVGGGVDYLLRVVASDINAYQRLIDTLLSAEVGIDRYFSYIVTKKIKATGHPLSIILNGAE